MRHTISNSTLAITYTTIILHISPNILEKKKTSTFYQPTNYNGKGEPADDSIDHNDKMFRHSTALGVGGEDILAAAVDLHLNLPAAGVPEAASAAYNSVEQLHPGRVYPPPTLRGPKP